MKLTDNLYQKIFFKGTIILFLFLHFNFFGSAQKYTLKIVNDRSELPKNIKKTNFRKTFSDSLLVLKQLKRIKTELISEGYIAASFDSVKFDSSIVKAYLFTGKKYQINELYIQGLFTLVKRKYNLPDSGTQIKKTLSLTDLPLLYENIIGEYENSGYPFATLIPEKIDFKDSLIRLKLLLQKNNLYRINKLILKGDANISHAFLKRFLSVYEGNIYNEEQIVSIEKKIKTLSFLSEILPPEVDFFDKKADVYLYLKSEKANLINGVAGFIPDKNNENKLTFTGNLDLNLLNNFGKGENIFLKWSRTAKLSQKFDVGFILPYIFKSPFSLQSHFYSDKRDTSFMKLSAKAGIDFNLKNSDIIRVFAENKQSLLLSAQNSDTSIFKNTKVLLFGLSYESENFDYKFNPSRGYFFNVGFAGGNRKVSGKSKKYYETNLIAEFYLPLHKRFVLKLASKTQYAFSDVSFYKNELFDLGGFNSLRGFDENRFQSPAYSVFTIEQRYLYERNSNVFAFFNIAGFNDFTETAKINIPYGFGIGTNLSTKAGIFSISYALGTLSDTLIRFSDSKIHIGYVNRF